MASLSWAFTSLLLTIAGSFLLEDYQAYKTTIALILYSSAMIIWNHSINEGMIEEVASLKRLRAKKDIVISDLEKQAQADKARIKSLGDQVSSLRLDCFFATQNARADIKKEMAENSPRGHWPKATGKLFATHEPTDEPPKEPEQPAGSLNNQERDKLLGQIAKLKAELDDARSKKGDQLQCPGVKQEKQSSSEPTDTLDKARIKAEVTQHMQLLRNEHEEVAREYKAEIAALQSSVDHYSVAFKDAHTQNAQYADQLSTVSAQYEERIASLESASVHQDQKNSRLKDKLFYRGFFIRNQKSKKQKAEASVRQLLAENAERAQYMQKMTAEDHRRKLAWNELQARWRKYRTESEDNNAKQMAAYQKASDTLTAQHKRALGTAEARHKREVEELQKKHNEAMQSLVSNHAASRLTRLQDDSNLTDQQREYVKRIEDRNEEFRKSWQDGRKLQKQVQQATEENTKLEQKVGLLSRRIDHLTKELSNEKANRLVSMLDDTNDD